MRKGEISGKNISMIFNATARLGEALAIIVRFITDEWEIKLRLLCLQLTAKSLKGEELARDIITVLAEQNHVQSNSLCAAMRDGASINVAAKRTVKVIFPKVVDMRCFSHAINGVGERFSIPTLRRFLQLWNALFCHSPPTRIAWRECTGISRKTYSQTRWWSWWEVANQAMLQFAEIQTVCVVNNRAATLRQLEEMLLDGQTKTFFQVEVAAVVDTGKPMVEATYILDGDGTLAWKCYKQLLVIQNSINAAHLPILRAVLRHISGENPAVGQQCFRCGVFRSSARMGPMNQQVEIFKAARLFSPHQIGQLHPVANDIDVLTSIAFLDEAAPIYTLKNDLPRYIARADGIAANAHPVEWWKVNEADLPFWSAVAKLILLIQPSSASSERVFSVLTTLFGHLQDLVLQDYIECSLMLQFNKR